VVVLVRRVRRDRPARRDRWDYVYLNSEDFMSRRVYLAGPITGYTFDGCTEWRDAVKKLLAADGIEAFSPMRAKEYLKAEGVLTGSYPKGGLFSSSRNIMTRDFFDCTNADVILANLLGSEKPSLGTVMEMAWAYQARIPLVVAMENSGNPHEHPMLDEAFGFRCSSLEDAVFVVKRILLP
jgi:nucleoside 2-deoxyribosyltransferase